jgi:uncharacterized membrane protein
MPFCTQCGQQVGATDAFCANCGRQQSAEGTSFGKSGTPSGNPGDSFRPTPPLVAADPLAGMSPRTASILCYIPTIGWIAAIVVLATQKFKTDQIVRFHAFQGLYLFAAWLVVQWVVHPIMLTMPSRIIRIDHVLEGLLLALSIFMIIKSSHGEPYVLPIIGELAQRSAAEQ